MMKKLFVTIFSLTLSLTFATTIFAADYIYTPIMQDAYTTRLSGINDIGTIVGDTMMPASQNWESYNVFHYADASYELITYPGSQNDSTFPNGINNNSVIVGSYQFTAEYFPFTLIRPFYYDGTDYNTFVTGFEWSRAHGVNESGIIVGYGDHPVGMDKTDDGYYDTHAWMRSLDGVVTVLDYPEAVHTFATDINNSGQIVGYYTDSDGLDHGFRYSSDTNSWDTFAVPGADEVSFWGINDAGQIVGKAWFDVYEDTFSFIMDANGSITPISLIGYSSDWLVNAKDINNEGQIVGWFGSNPNDGFLINTVPIPGAVWLLGSGLIGIVGIRRKFKS